MAECDVYINATTNRSTINFEQNLSLIYEEETLQACSIGGISTLEWLFDKYGVEQSS
jgi:hypothetical protein